MEQVTYGAGPPWIDQAGPVCTVEEKIPHPKEKQPMRSEKALARKNLVVDQDEVRALKRVLKVATESEAVRIAVRDRLALEDAQAALHRIRSRGGLEDVFHRSPSGQRKPTK